MELRPGAPEEAGMSAQRILHIPQLAQRWVEQDVTPALVVLVARRGIIVLHEAFGHLTPDPDAPALPRDAIYPLASLTKPITATAAMSLVEDGLLGLNRPVAEYIPEFVGAGKNAVLVHHLLTHTSGLRDEDLLARAERELGIPPPDEYHLPLWILDHASLFYDAPLWKPPGTEMSYCNYGYTMLGEIIQRVSGHSLADFARERIFEPLGMTDTAYSLPEALRQRVVRRPADAPYPDLDTLAFQEAGYAAGGAFSTALDMAIFGQAFLHGGAYGSARILSPATVAEMIRDQIPGLSGRDGNLFFPEASWSFGWNIQGNKKVPMYGSLYSSRAFSHDGAGGVDLWVDPAHDLVGVYFSVVRHLRTDGLPNWCADLFVNAVTAAVIDA